MCIRDRSQYIHASASGWSPVYVSDNLSCMSIEFLLPSSEAAIIWRGPKKNGLIKQFLKDVDWTGGLADEADGSMVNPATGRPWIDYLLVDTPPGTSDEHLSIVGFLRESGIDGAVLITTPQEVALLDVRKEIAFCRKMGVPILGVVENMSGFVCPSCHGRSDIFFASTGGARALCEELGLRFLGACRWTRASPSAATRARALWTSSPRAPPVPPTSRSWSRSRPPWSRSGTPGRTGRRSAHQPTACPPRKLPSRHRYHKLLRHVQV